MKRKFTATLCLLFFSALTACGGQDIPAETAPTIRPAVFSQDAQDLLDVLGGDDTLAFFDYTGLLAGVDMTIYKRVPVRAGMAGGSADAAGVLVGLNELYGAHLSMSELCAIGAGIGADVPFALLGGTCRVRGVGDLMKALPPCPDCRFVVAMPSVGVSTPEAFARYDMMGSLVHPDCEAQEQAIRDCNLAGVCAAGGNALEHCSGAVETPAICKTLREHGAVMAQMTGSGAAVFGIFDDENAARSAVAALKNGYKQVYLCKPTHGGPRVTVRRLFGAKK